MKASARQRRRLLAAMSLVGGAMALTLAIAMPKRVFWNASASVPIGFYIARPEGDLTVGDLVIVRPPEPIASFAVARGYLGPGVPMLKRIAALPGAVVCRTGGIVRVGDVHVVARSVDSLGRLLPVWEGCRRIGQGELLLLNASVPDSLDGRYFGPLPSSSVIARAKPVWTRGGR